MLTEERMVRIMDLLHKNSFVSIQDLMKRFQVSRSSIMRDLQELEEQGRILRVRGGASLVDTDVLLSRYNEPAVQFKEDTQKDAKKIICHKAIEEVHDGDCIFIDAGTTPVYLLEGLKHKDVELVTTNTYLLERLPLDFKGHVYLLGGEFSKKYDSSFGSMTTHLLKQFRFDLCFLTANGISVQEDEAYVFDMHIGTIKKEVQMRSRKSILLIDHTKLKTRAFYTWSNLSSFSKVYMDTYPNNERMPENFKICKEIEND